MDRGRGPVATAAVQKWTEKVRRFLKRKAPDDPLEERRVKVHRKATYELLVCLENGLRSVSDGLRYFSPTENLEWPRLPMKWPVLALTSDMGSDDVCAWQFLAWGLRLCIDASYDPSHRAWNDLKASLRGALLWPHCVLMMMAYNAGAMLGFGGAFRRGRIVSTTLGVGPLPASLPAGSFRRRKPAATDCTM